MWRRHHVLLSLVLSVLTVVLAGGKHAHDSIKQHSSAKPARDNIKSYTREQPAAKNTSALLADLKRDLWRERNRGLAVVELAMPERVLHGGDAQSLLGDVTIKMMCRLDVMCAGRGDVVKGGDNEAAAREGRVLVTLEPAVRKAFFSSPRAVGGYCGAPLGYVGNVEAGSEEAMAVLQDPRCDTAPRRSTWKGRDHLFLRWRLPAPRVACCLTR